MVMKIERAQFAIVGDPMQAVVAAAQFRRSGVQVQTYLSGREKAQRKKAMADADKTLTVQQALGLAVAHE